MKNIRGIYQDCDPIDTPQGNTFYTKNAVLTEGKGAIENEPGHVLLTDDTRNSQKHYVGSIALNNGDTLVFYVEFNDSAQVDFSGIQIIKDDGTIVRVIDDSVISKGQLNFSKDNPIDAEFYVNFEGDRIVAFIEDNNVPRIINVDKDYFGNPITIDDLYLFSNAQFDCLDVSIPTTGGAVLSGSYAFTYRYIDNDQSTTDWAPISKSVPVVVGNANLGGSEAGLNTGKALQIVLNKPDRDYDQVEFAVIKSINGVISVASFTTIGVPSFGPVNVIYNNSGLETDLLLEEIITPTAKFTRAKAITQLNNRLYLGNLEEVEQIDYQKYALDIEIGWNVELVDIFDPRIAKQSVFYPGEVYAFYIQFQLEDGTFTKAFHIPGKAPNATQLQQVTVNSATEGTQTYLRFQIEDTCSGGITAQGVGISPGQQMGVWQNQNETYPNNDAYNSPGGKDLRKKKVLHHKFPTLNYIKKNTNSTPPGIVSADIGKSVMPLLSITTDNVVIPPELKDKVVGYRILHAKRNLNNSTSIGDSILTFSGLRALVNDPQYYPSCGAMDVVACDSSLGTNGNADDNINGYFGNVVNPLNWKGENDPKFRPPLVGKPGAGVSKFIRYHGFNLLLDKPAITPDLIRLELKITINGGSDETKFPQVLEPYDGNDRYRYNVFNVISNVNVNANSIAKVEAVNTGIGNTTESNYIPIRFEQYVPTGAIVSPEGLSYNNVAGEEHVLLVNKDPINRNIVSLGYDQLTYVTKTNPTTQQPLQINNIGGSPVSDGSGMTSTPGYATYVATLIQIKQDVYPNFQNQELVPVDNCFVTNDLTPIPVGTEPLFEFKGGDSFAARKCVNMTAPLDAEQSLVASGGIDDAGRLTGDGCKVAVVFAGFNPKNETLRHSETSKPQTEFFLKSTFSPLTGGLSTFTPEKIKSIYLGRQVLNEPFDYLYEEDYSLRLQGNTTPVAAFDPTVAIDRFFPNQIARSIQQDPNQNSLNWKTFLVQDTYTMPRKNGEIINLEAVGNQRLYIHLRNTLFITKDRTTLKGDIQSVTLGAGDIFDVPPFEVVSTDGGYAGTQHKFGCVLTKLGYVFPDASQGKVFIHTGNDLQELTREGLRIFFRDNIIKDLSDNPFQAEGFTIGYDENFNRLMITQVSASNPTKQFTVSYSPEVQAIVSFHDYYPRFYVKQWRNELLMYERNINPQVYSMSKDRYDLTFLGAADKAPLIIDVVYNDDPYETKVFNSLQWITEVVDTITLRTSKETTFDSVSIYNDTKATGQIDLKQDNMISKVYENTTRNTETTWNFNKLRNIAGPVAEFRTGYADNFEIDASELSPNISWYKKARFIDNYVICRFRYNNEQDFKFRLLDSKMFLRKSHR